MRVFAGVGCSAWAKADQQAARRHESRRLRAARRLRASHCCVLGMEGWVRARGAGWRTRMLCGTSRVCCAAHEAVVVVTGSLTLWPLAAPFVPHTL